jgi:hypothetical protein
MSHNIDRRISDLSKEDTKVHRRAVVATIFILFSLIAASCGGSKLTNAKASKTVVQWEGSFGGFICRCNPPCAINSGELPVEVTGVQELPQENAARAILTFQKAPLTHACPGGRIYSGPGEANFIHYTDGRWVLTKVSTSEGINSYIWDNLNIEAR